MSSPYTCTEGRRRSLAAGWGCAFFAFCLLPVTAAVAQTFDSLVMPGKVIAGHAKLETECKSCHTPFKKADQSRLCRECHKPVAEDIAGKRGYHGLAPAVQDKECKACHSDHKGREANIASFDEKSFNHDFTDFALRNAHAPLECKSCHAPRTKFRDARATCVLCHRKDDKHKGEFGEKCQDCHSDKTWKDAKFDHEKTRFSLAGKHADAKCETCHANNRFKDTPRACVACHRKDDKHKGAFGEKCETCHGAADWKTTFNHARSTRYPLLGKHAAAKCEACHRAPLYAEKLPTRCVSCHMKDDSHKGTLGDKCENCHKETGWTNTNFEHNRDTKFPLFNKHKAAVCGACHKNGLKEKLPLVCVECHRKNDSDSHQGRFGKACEACHDDKGWKPSTFDHGKSTRYPLRLSHAKGKCAACHTGPLFVKDGGRALPTDCLSCHRKDDAHKGQLGEQCAACHDEGKWTGVPYDHNKAKFKLTGSHARTLCKSCHKSPQFKDAPSVCSRCHEGDDVHKKTLGGKCEFCHSTRSWKTWDFDHQRQTRFTLDGAHTRLLCNACHKKPVADPAAGIPELSRSCFACHSGDDTHSGGFGQTCERCHVTRDWRSLKPGITRSPGKS